jgi:hypothetical protein
MFGNSSIQTNTSCSDASSYHVSIILNANAAENIYPVKMPYTEI